MELNVFNALRMLKDSASILYDLDKVTYNDISENDITIVPIVSNGEGLLFKVEIHNCNHTRDEVDHLIFEWVDHLDRVVLCDEDKDPFEKFVGDYVGIVNVRELDWYNYETVGITIRKRG